MTLLARLRERIERAGPLSVAEYMAECLFDPQYGYYTTSDPLGSAGDFITAPEISQMFGELIGLWMAQVWIDQGRPAPFQLVELGPGRGTLMRDVLRATRAVPGFHDAAQVSLVEISPVLREAQTELLAGWTPRFHDSIADLDDTPVFLIANEFFDALPIRQFQRTENGIQERQIGLDGDQLVWGLAPPVPFLNDNELALGQVVETCPAAEAIAGEIGRRLSHQPGAALIVDYGDWTSRGPTFQAVRNHQSVNPLIAPGHADLTAHVAFGPLARAAAPAPHSGLTTQGVFLERLGITERAKALARNLTGDALDQHIAAHKRLTHPAEMGELFKVLALASHNAPMPLPGLDMPR